MSTAPVWLKPVLHPVYLRLICAQLQRLGFGPDQIVQGTRLTWQDIHGHNQFLSFEQARRLIVRALELSQRPWLGLEVGASTQLSAHGAVGYAAMASSNIGQALQLMERFVELRQSVAAFRVVTNDQLQLILDERVTSPDVREVLLGHFAAGIVHLIQSITGLDLRSRLKIYWPFAEPPWSQRYKDFCPQLEYGAPALCIQLPIDLLATPSLAPDPEAYHVAVRECERQLQQHKGGSVAFRVHQRLLAAESHYPTLSEMAALENVSTRTLIRQLNSEGLCYQQLLDRVREELACWLLVQTPLSVEAVAERLGYQDTSNFSRTFKRWLGVSPLVFRQATKAPEIDIR